MDTLFRSIILLASTKVVFADVSHFFFPESALFQPPQQQSHPFLYAPPPPPFPNPVQQPPPVSSTTEFFLPEVISNRRLKDSSQHNGNFIPFNQYLPPPVDDGHNTFQTAQTPSLAYLPPKAEKPIVVLDDPSSGDQGYEYHEPSTSTSNPNDEEPSLQFPSALLPPAAENPVFLGDNPTPTTTTKKPNQGYYYDPPGTSFPENPIFQDSGSGKVPQVRLHVKEMRCLENKNGFFRAVLQIESFLSTTPLIENDSNDPKCSVKLNRNLLIVNVEAEDFQKCGVHYCGKELCLRLRFPSIRGIRTSFDSLLALRCTTQNRVAAKTHALKMGISNDIRKAKNTDVYAHGGAQNEFRTHIELLRKTSNGFSKRLEPNDVVRLGEELLLRAHVGAGDGWNFTKLTDVNLQLISGTGDLTRSVNLITSHGCVNPSMRSICPQIPIFEPPLGHRFQFKAVMFQEMRSGEEMVLSMKVTGCLEQNDCLINVQDCNGGGTNFKRQRRNTQNNSTNFSEFSKISFRVEMPFDEQQEEGELVESNEFRIIVQSWIVVAVLLVVGSLCLLGVIIYCFARKNTDFVTKY
ncbi:uncharacterized protein LOC129911042 [Episyrphus balteatus]|uniref:uncharacterized protein LOC129911042 n=1 Tax=Episyrphus balteatus TaxID=286459 RepID=UPI002485E5AE|nr:uncharacterized protein LOC129911042 [Episyrphus balteatus]